MRPASQAFILRDAAKTPLLRMRVYRRSEKR
jgi:hypothetical protein